MKLKNILILAFLTLTIIPIFVASLLLYKSAFNLSKESYNRNLIESISVQSDYLAQAFEGDMIADYRFANRVRSLLSSTEDVTAARKNDLLTAFHTYLESAEDKITACILLDRNGVPLYTIGETAVLNVIAPQLPQWSKMDEQTIQELEVGQGIYSLGIVTPILDSGHAYAGSLISVYDRSYIFKIISSYYKISDTSTFICRENGNVIKARLFLDDRKNDVVKKTLDEMTFDMEGVVDIDSGAGLVSGYYKNIRNSPWYLVGFIEHNLIYSFMNQFIWVYILMILAVLIADIFLSFYFSRKVVEPINRLIKVMGEYQNSLSSEELHYDGKNSYYETQYLWAKFSSLMKTILLVQHNFKGIYRLYQSNDMDDTNIDIDVKKQIIQSNKAAFQELLDHVELAEGDCVVEKLTKCFCEKDRSFLMTVFENMRDRHLSVTREAEVYTPHLNRKWFHILVVPMYEDDQLSGLFIQLRDISRLKKQEYESIEMARRDALTGLYNRVGFTERVEKALNIKEGTDMHALLFLDMNYFKLVNDNFGHSAGDDLLRSVGKILSDAVEPGDVVSRFGGDEFAVFLPHTFDEKIEAMKSALEKRLVFPMQAKETTFVVSASVGVSVWNRKVSSCTLEELLRQADAAMYRSKRAFKELAEKPS